MIISLNENNMDKYKALFAKAYQELEALGKIREGCQNDEKRFLSLDDYFAHMGDLLELDLTYMMLPLDEQPFSINANSRVITAPKITVLQNDQVAETIMFTIDRYFDYMDLNNATVYVQWTLPDGRTEGATEIEMKDIEFEPGKIRFGWPLDSEITSQAGTVKYSVRFWIRDTIKDAMNQDVEKVVYSFNTLSSSFVVSPSLQVDINAADEVNAPHRENIFVNAIRNSMITNGSVALPQDPSFSAPGRDLPIRSHLVDDTLTLEALAVVGDNGILSYEWYYTPAVDITINGTTFTHDVKYAYEPSTTKVVDSGDVVTTVALPGFKEMGGTVGVRYEEFDYSPANVSLSVKDQYYVEDTSTTPPTYKAYKGGLNKPTDSTIKLYRKFTTYTVPTGTIAVTGAYEVRAINSTRVGSNATSAIPSSTCLLVSPLDVKITQNLNSRAFIENTTSDIKILTNASSQPTDATKTVTWERAVSVNGDGQPTGWQNIDNNDASLNIYDNGPGWYRATPSVVLNREPKTATSAVCKVTALPCTPELKYSNGVPMQDGIASFDTDNAQLVVNIVDTSLKADVPGLQSEVAYDASLFSEEITYTWYKQEINKEEQAISTADVQSGLIIGAFDTNTLQVHAPNKIATTFTCKVVNHIGEKSSEAATLSFFVN